FPAECRPAPWRRPHGSAPRRGKGRSGSSSGRVSLRPWAVAAPGRRPRLSLSPPPPEPPRHRRVGKGRPGVAVLARFCVLLYLRGPLAPFLKRSRTAWAKAREAGASCHRPPSPTLRAAATSSVSCAWRLRKHAAHPVSRIDAPVVARDSRSRWACWASLRGYL